MINCVKRKKLDTLKYDNCIKKSIQSSLYAYSWYLDIVADSWQVLVLNDYEAVMPIPFMRAKRNLFIKKVMQPPFCQQLGVFYGGKTNFNIEKMFFEKFLKFSPQVYHFNSKANYCPNTLPRINYELPLNRSYPNLRSSFRKDRKYRINQAEKRKLIITTSGTLDDVLVIFKENYRSDIYKKKHLKKLKILVKESIEKNRGEVICVKDRNSNLLGGAFIVFDKKRVVYLFSAFSDYGKRQQAPSFLINKLIERFSKTSLIFDFEGSMIKSIASFFRSFNAKKTEYYLFSS